MAKIFPVNIFSRKSEKSFKLELKNYSREFYDAHPDMAPRGNILLYYGRVAGLKEIDKKLDSAFKVTPWMKAKFWIINKAMDFLDWIEKKK